MTNASTAYNTSSSAVGGKSLTGQDFMHLMITQLQNQDPMSPTDSNQLLQQISQISSLQSSYELQSTLTSMTLQQSIGAGGNLIGRVANGLDISGKPVAGMVVGVRVENQKVSLVLYVKEDMPLEEMPLENVIGVADVALFSDGSGGESEGGTGSDGDTDDDS